MISDGLRGRRKFRKVRRTVGHTAVTEQMNEIVWGNYTKDELDRQYDQSTLVANTG